MPYLDYNRRLERSRIYYRANREEVLVKQRAYWHANSLAFSKKAKLYRELHKEEISNKAKANYEINKEEILNNNKAYYRANKKVLNSNSKAYAKLHRKEIADYKKIYYSLPENKKARSEYFKIRKSNNIQFRLSTALRTRLNGAIKNGNKSGSAVRNLGCSVSELVLYLESKFLEGMTWQNHTKNGWHIDHIKPLYAFDLTDIEQLKQACHYTNLQPLWAFDNHSKHNIWHQ